MFWKRKYWTKDKKIAAIGFCIMNIVIIPAIFFILMFLTLVIFKNEGFSQSYKIITSSRIWSYKLELILNIIISISIPLILEWIYITIKAQKDKKLITVAKEKSHGKAEWLINEDEKPMFSSKKINSLLKPFEKAYWRDFTEPSFVVRSEMVNNKVHFWGSSVAEVVHGITIGGTGSGKSQKVIIPTILANATLEKKKKPCMVIADPKGELRTGTSGFFVEQGYEVLTFNLRDTIASNGWNPLAIVYKKYMKALAYREKYSSVEVINHFLAFKKLWEEYKCKEHVKRKCEPCITNYLRIVGNEEYINVIINNSNENDFEDKSIKWKECQMVVVEKEWFIDFEKGEEVIAANIQKEKIDAQGEVNDLVEALISTPKDDKQWADGAKSLFKGMINVLLERMSEDPSSITEEQFNLYNVVKGFDDQERTVEWFKKWRVGRETNQSVTFMDSFLMAGDKTRASYISTIAASTGMLKGDDLLGLLNKNEIDLVNFVQADKPKVLFLVIPDDRTDKHGLATLMISQFYKASILKANENKMRTGKETLERKLLFLLDEFGNMPAIPNFATILTVSRSRGIHFNLVLQSFSQLTSKYGKEDSLTIEGNCLLTVYLKSPDIETHKKISEMCGVKTIEVRQGGSRKGPDGKKIPDSYSLQQQPLIIPADIPMLPSTDGIKDPKIINLKQLLTIVISQNAKPSITRMELSYTWLDKWNFQKNEVKKPLSIIDSKKFKDHYFLDIKAIDTSLLDNKKKKNGEGVDAVNNLLSDYKRGDEKRIIRGQKMGMNEQGQNQGLTKMEKLDRELLLKKKELELREELLTLQAKPQDEMSSGDKQNITLKWKELESVIKEQKLRYE